MGSGRVTAGGFQGAIEHLPLPDLLQVWSQNRFSGMVSISSEERVGRLYFAEGQIVHAEAEGRVGEPALQLMIGWRDGGFEPYPNTSTLERTIQKGLSHLLLDAHRVLDEARRQPGAAPPPLPAPQPARPSPLDRLRGVAGVRRIVLHGGDGRPRGSEGPEADALAAKGLYLATNHAHAVAEAFGLRDLQLAAVASPCCSFVLAQREGNYLGVEVDPGAPVDAVEEQVRALFFPPSR